MQVYALMCCNGATGQTNFGHQAHVHCFCLFFKVNNATAEMFTELSCRQHPSFHICLRHTNRQIETVQRNEANAEH